MKESSGWKKTFWIAGSIFLICFLYALVRYNVVRSVSYEHIPLYISNKAISLASTFLIGMSFVIGPLARFFPNTFVNLFYLRKPLGIVGFGIAAIHAIMSLLLFDKANYPKFFLESGKLNFTGEITMLFGVLAFFIFAVLALIGIPSVEEKLSRSDWQAIQRLGYIAYMLVLFHVALMGWKGWFEASSWQYGLASITLVSSLFIVFVLLTRFVVVFLPHTKQ